MHKSSLLTLLSFLACATVARCGTCSDGPWTICTSQVNYLKNTASLLCDQATYDAKVKCYIDAGCWDDPAYAARNQMVFQQLRDSKCTGVSATGVVSGDPTFPPGSTVINGATGVVSGDPTFPPGGVSGGSSSTVVIDGAGAGMPGMSQATQDLMKCVASPTAASDPVKLCACWNSFAPTYNQLPADLKASLDKELPSGLMATCSAIGSLTPAMQTKMTTFSSCASAAKDDVKVCACINTAKADAEFWSWLYAKPEVKPQADKCNGALTAGTTQASDVVTVSPSRFVLAAACMAVVTMHSLF